MKMDQINNIVNDQMEQVYTLRVECLREEKNIQNKITSLKSNLKKVSVYTNQNKNSSSSDSEDEF